MKKQNYTEDNYNIIQVVMKSQECKFVLPKDHKVFCFLEFMKGLDLNKYLKKEKDTRGRKATIWKLCCLYRKLDYAERIEKSMNFTSYFIFSSA
jgi:hypothetical protein